MKPTTNIKSQKQQQKALIEYQQSKEESRYRQLAQKLSQHIENLAEDPNTRIRWVWELIQNAKDVPNKFGKVFISIEITDTHLRFSHNGDPFRSSDLESIVSQYSSKPEENKMESDTTGKYGTGFITTYILSRKLIVEGTLQVYIDMDLQDDSDGGKSDWSSDEDKSRKATTEAKS
jgi:hypothetical protein